MRLILETLRYLSFQKIELKCLQDLMYHAVHAMRGSSHSLDVCLRKVGTMGLTCTNDFAIPTFGIHARAALSCAGGKNAGGYGCYWGVQYRPPYTAYHVYWFLYACLKKRDVLCRGNVRPSVCPSVRPRFPDFSSTCFEISIWNLVYAFSRWHDMSSLSCITIGSIWPSLQPKVGQTNFLQSWPHKSR